MGVVPTWPMSVTKVNEGLGRHGDRTAAPSLATGPEECFLVKGRDVGSEPKRWTGAPLGRDGGMQH